MTINKHIAHLAIILSVQLLLPARLHAQTEGQNYRVTETLLSADGIRLRTIHRTAIEGMEIPVSDAYQLPHLGEDRTLSVDSTLYIGAFEIEGGGTATTARYYFSKGYVDIQDSVSVIYNYMVRDHLGSVRLVDRVVPGTTTYEIVQVNNYYAYGGLHTDEDCGTDVQPHKFGGKVLDTMHGQNWYDFHARQQDAATGMFTSMDPLCEKYYHISPYVYCAGNPVLVKPLANTYQFYIWKSKK